MDTGTLLGIWAHPDDEAYLSAGLMARARRAGRRVVVVTATYGEHGTDDPDRWPPARLAARRRRELVASLGALGVREHHWLGHPDGGCADVTEDDAVGALGSIIERVRPHTIVTFGPDGMTGHPDHCAVSSWATAARQRHRPRARLWYATLLPSFHRDWGELNRAIGLFPDGSAPPETVDSETAAVVRLSGWLGQRKSIALRAHASQVMPLRQRVGPATFDRWWSTEAFVDAATVDAADSERSAHVLASAASFG